MFTPEFILLITAMAAVVVGITQKLKEWFKVEGGFVCYILSLVVSVITMVPNFSTMPFVHWLMAVIFVWLVANGWYSFGVALKKKK